MLKILKMNLFINLVSLLFCSYLIKGCFITNCPPGGKRSLTNNPLIKQCMKCGPLKLGTCFGPKICCGPIIGCQIDNEISNVCSLENLNTKPCKINGFKCGNGSGTCATKNICCTTEKCFQDKSCMETNNEKTSYIDNLIDLENILLRKNYKFDRESSSSTEFKNNKWNILSSIMDQ